MQFVEDGVCFTISEAKENDKVHFMMDDGENAPYGYFVELDIHNLIRLRDWLSESIKTLQE